ncbi:hypothetical protein EDD16DRAFT_1684371 [Pisolithus croceorrhizus]|nr:hypothetical protein EDD16DRAFT_1684371 [Pisolithus croceorrhizus]KAI6129111.1 hypothetical protein EV401DRAFT_1929513 [Pisolithus croceorrhizus]KAI6164260.1 hypothetical protein EDD17DRAFT_1506731 [Pisolithus thermaeus]
MDPQSAGSPVHAGVYNRGPYALKNALGQQRTQAKPDPNAVVCPTDLGKTEVADRSSLPCHPGHVDQSYLSNVAAGHTLVPTHISCDDVYRAVYGTNQNFVYPSTHPMDINYLGSCNEHSSRQIQHHPSTHHATNGITVAATGPTENGNQTPWANFSSVSQKKPHGNGLNDCEPKKCLYLHPDGKSCSQLITCAQVPEHFISHGIVKKSRRERISCRWYECPEKVMRHNFVRHIREKHLGHVRGSATHGFEKERK